MSFRQKTAHIANKPWLNNAHQQRCDRVAVTNGILKVQEAPALAGTPHRINRNSNLMHRLDKVRSGRLPQGEYTDSKIFCHPDHGCPPEQPRSLTQSHDAFVAQQRAKITCVSIGKDLKPRSLRIMHL